MSELQRMIVAGVVLALIAFGAWSLITHESSTDKAKRLQTDMTMCDLLTQSGHGVVTPDCLLTQREYNKFMSGR